MTLYHAHYWVVLFHPITEVIRSLGYVPIVIMDYFVKFLKVMSVWAFVFQGYSLCSAPLDPLTLLDVQSPHTPPPTPPLIPLQIPNPIPNPLLQPPPPFPFPPEGLFPLPPTTSRTTLTPSSVWRAHRGPESSASKFIARPYYASL